MSKLRGSFSFVIYDAQVGYVLATNDCNGTHTMWQAHIASDNSLLVACNCEISIAYIERTPIAAGEYKFGWRSLPVPYMASSETVMSKCSEARQAALDALAVCCLPCYNKDRAYACACTSVRPKNQYASDQQKLVLLRAIPSSLRRPWLTAWPVMYP